MASERRRTKYDIYADVVDVIAKKGVCSLTRISYGANMPVDRAKKIVNFLVSHGFVREVTASDRTKYRATKWGLEYLETLRRMQKFFAALEEPVEVKIPEVTLPDRVTTGYKELDTLLFGGIPQNYAVLLTSPSCDERDLLAKRFLETGAKAGQTTFHVTTDIDGVKDLIEKFQQNFHVLLCNPRADLISADSPNVIKLKGVENLTEISIALASASKAVNMSLKKPKRICIEIISDVLLQHQAVQTRRWLTGMMPELKSKGFTTLAVMNPYMHTQQEVHAILGMFEGEITIYEKETARGLEKFLKIRKMHAQQYLETKLSLNKEKLKV